MKLSLHKKLVLALLISISLVIVTMIAGILWSFDQSFKTHVLAEINRKDDYIVEQLVELYQVNNSWDFVKDNPSIWFNLNSRVHLRRGPPGSRPPPPRGPRRPPEDGTPPNRPPPDMESRQDRDFDRRPPPRRPRREMDRVLLDKNKIPIVQTIGDLNNYELKEIKAENDLIGYLARRPLSNMLNPDQRRFIRHLRDIVLMIAISAIFIALIIAWLLSRHFLKPIGKLKEGTSALTLGNYNSRIDVVSEDELGELTQDFNMLAKTLEENEKSRKQWIADISHELRTPLSILRGEIEAVNDGVREMNDERIQALHSQILHLNNLVNDLYELSMTDMGSMNYQMEGNDIVEILRECIDDIHFVSEEKSISIDASDVTTESIEVLSDYQRMHQLFSNIMMNSIKYTHSPGELKISSESDAKNIIFHFMDSAPGVPNRELPRLFERLYRGESSRNRETGGSGLGLSICSIIIEAHHGTMTAQHSPLGGLWITITLPIYI